MTLHPCPRSRTGAALALVLWAVFVMCTTLIVVVSLVDFDLELEGLGARRFEARQRALDGIALATHPKIKRGDPILAQTLRDGSRIDVVIASEDARLNINRSLTMNDGADLVRLFRYWGLDEKEAAVAVDSLKDWIDADEFRGLHGAEASDLAEQTWYSRPENRPFLRVAEMASVRGMDAVARVKPDWAGFFSVRSSGRLALQDASTDLLEVIGTLDAGQAAALVAFRSGPDGVPSTSDDPEIDSVQAVAAVIPLNPAQIQILEAAFGPAGKMRRISSRGSCGGLVHEIAAVSIAAPGSRGGYLEWEEK